MWRLRLLRFLSRLRAKDSVRVFERPRNSAVKFRVERGRRASAARHRKNVSAEVKDSASISYIGDEGLPKKIRSQVRPITWNKRISTAQDALNSRRPGVFPKCVNKEFQIVGRASIFVNPSEREKPAIVRGA